MSEDINNINSINDVNSLPADASFEIAATKLQQNLQNRGSIGKILAESAELDRNLMESRLANPEAYILGDIISCDTGTKYRSGVDGNDRYMTVDDFLRFCSDGDEYLRKSHGRHYSKTLKESYDARVNLEKRPAAAYGVADAYAPGSGKGRRLPVFSGNTETELEVAPEGSEKSGKLATLGRKYIGRETVVNAGVSARHAGGVIAAISLIAVFSLLLSIPVGLHILIQQENESISELKTEIAEIEKENEQLEIELRLRNEEADIKTLAINEYGMRDVDTVDYTFLKLNSGDTVTLGGEENTEQGILPRLLKALGLRSDN